jgi:hypothetical protein
MIPPNSELAAALRSALETFLASSEPDPLDLQTIARHARVLPVLRGWGALGAIRLDGTPVEVTYEPPYELTEVQDRGMSMALLGHCAFKFPELSALRPARPPDAVQCQLCGGTGRSDTASYGICLCGGLGWVVPQTKGAV